MLRTAIPFVLGLALGRTFPIGAVAAWCMVLAAFGLWIVLLLRRQVYARRWANGLVFMALMAAFGLLWQSLRDERQRGDHVDKLMADAVAWQLEVVSPPLDNGRTLRAWTRAQAACVGGAWQSARGGVLTTLLADSTGAVPVQGDRLLVHARLETIHRIPSPGGFDVRQWAAGKEVFHQAFAPTGHWRRLNAAPARPGFFPSARERINGWLRNAGLPERERALAKALLLGQRDELQSDQTEAFVRSGTIHVLAVSGTHVGIIYGALLLGLAWLPAQRRGRLIKGLLSLLALWAYAGLTGFAPSVLRATIMFSLFALAQMVRWQSGSINSLATAAVLLLLWDPSMLRQLGFQLSFLAVLGILVFYDPIHHLWKPPNAVLRFFWALASVTLAAQAFTAPLCLYVFQAFPMWFLPANMAVVGLIAIALYGSIALVVFQAIPVLGPLAATLMRWLFLLLGAINGFFAWLPAAYPAIRVGVWGMVGGYVLLACLASWLLMRARWARHATFLTLAALLVGWAWTANRRNAQRGFVAYPQRDGFACAFVEGRTLHLFATAPDDYLMRNVREHARADGLYRVLRTDSLPASVAHGGIDFIFRPGGMRQAPVPGRHRVVLYHGPTDDGVGDGLTETTEEWVLASALASRDRRRMLQQADESGRACFDMRTSGAYVRRE